MKQNTGIGITHIIIADDEALLCVAVADYLGDNGYKVSVVHDGSGVLPILEREKVDLVLLDLAMPGMNGLETLAVIKKQSPSTRVIILSGYGEMSNVEQARQLGSDGFITKPFGLGALHRHIKTVLSNESRTSFHEPPIKP